MASERTQSRRRHCIFQRALCHFRSCERKPRAGCSGAYEIRTDSFQELVGHWVSLDSLPREADSQRALQKNTDAHLNAHRDARPESPLTADHHMEEMTEDPLHLYLNRIGPQFLGSDLPSASLPQVVVPHPRASRPPSPSVSSMEMDVAADVDPETGERALG